LLDPRQNLASIPGQAVKTFQQGTAQRRNSRIRLFSVVTLLQLSSVAAPILG
jgi:hypothetical protein